MIDAIRDVIVAKAEASRRYHDAPTPSFAAFISGAVLIGAIVGAGLVL